MRSESSRPFATSSPPLGVSEQRETGSALAFRVPTSSDARELNRILGLERLEQLDDLGAFFEGRRFWVSLDPEVELDDARRDRGLTPDYPWQKFERKPEPVATETELRIGDADERFGRVFAAAYGIPATFADWLGRLAGRTGWRCLAAYDDGAPIATGALFTAGEVGWLGFGATLPSHRGRGAQSALLAARIALGADLGLRVLVTETGVLRAGKPGPSYRNILRASFREAYVRPNYASS